MAALRYIYHFKLDKAIPLDGELSFAEVAARTDTSAVNARRVLRLAMTMNLFREPRPGYVAHTAGSSLMHSRMPTLRSWVGFCKCRRGCPIIWRTSTDAEWLGGF